MADLNEREFQEVDFSEDSIAKRSLKFVINTWKVNKGMLIKLFVAAFLIGLYISQLMVQNILVVAGRQNSIYWDPFSAVYYYFTTLAFPLGLIITVIICICVISYWVVRKKGYVYDPTRGVKVAASGEGGTAHFMTEEEENVTFHRSKDITKFKHLIMGYDEKGYLVAKNDDVSFTSPNAVYIGEPGSGKSTAIIYPNIQQCIRLGDSFIATDSKGDIYRQTAYIVEKMGYTIKVVNFKSDEMKNSNGVEFMKTIHSEQEAETLTTIIMDNAGGGEKEKKDFWYKCEYNLLNGLILYVKFNNKGRDRNLIAVFDILINKGIDGIDLMAQQAQPSDPYYAPLRIFTQSEGKVKESAFGGLCTRLSKFSTEVVRNILSSDEIDFRLPLSQKCAYYVIIPDVVNPMAFISCMFFTTLFNELINESDRRYGGKPPVHVRFFLDEFRATGNIPNFSGILSVARSRKLFVSFILQDIPQLDQMYTEEDRQIILNNCATKVLLKSSNHDTLKYFSDLSGEQTIVSEGRGYSENKLDPFKLHSDESITRKLEKRALMTPSDLQMLDKNKMFVMIDGKAIILTKFMYWTHPFYKVMQAHPMEPSEYIPDWRKRLIASGHDIKNAFEDEENQDDYDDDEIDDQNEDQEEQDHQQDRGTADSRQGTRQQSSSQQTTFTGGPGERKQTFQQQQKKQQKKERQNEQKEKLSNLFSKY